MRMGSAQGFGLCGAACIGLAVGVASTPARAQQGEILFDTLDGFITVIEAAVAAAEPEPEPLPEPEETLIACFGHPEQPFASNIELEQVLLSTENGTDLAKSFVSQIPSPEGGACPGFATGLLDAAASEVESQDVSALKSSALHLISCSDPGAQSLTMEAIQDLQVRIGAAIRGHETAAQSIAEKRVACGL